MSLLSDWYIKSQYARKSLIILESANNTFTTLMLVVTVKKVLLPKATVIKKVTSQDTFC